MPKGTGVTYKHKGGDKWQLRWRERSENGWISRSHTMRGSEIERDRTRVEIRASLRETGHFDVAAATAERRPPANLLEGMLQMIREREGTGKYRGKTPLTYRSYSLRLLDHLHAITGIPVDQPMPVTVLCRPVFARIQERDAQLNISRSTRYGSMRLLMDAWDWLADDPHSWPQVPAPPSRGARKDYLPRTARYGRTVAPTIEQVDACLRSLPPKTTQSTRVAGVLLRYTGLRASQVFAIERDDVDLAAGTLRVRGGRSDQEREEQRVVPLSPALLTDPHFLGWIEACRQGPLFPKRRHSRRAGSGARRKLPVVTFRDAWEASGAPSHVWAPPNRRNTRPEHAFRAAFQAFLRDQGVAEDVIDFLVGHHPAGERELRDIHYGRELAPLARDAVARLPPIQWTPDEPENVVAFATRD